MSLIHRFQNEYERIDAIDRNFLKCSKSVKERSLQMKYKRTNHIRVRGADIDGDADQIAYRSAAKP